MNQVKICGNTTCQSQNALTSKFCTKCGYKFEIQHTYHPIDQQSQYTPTNVPIENDPIAKLKQFTKTKYPVVLKKGKELVQKINVSKKTMIFSGIAVAALAILVILLAVMLGNQSSMIKHAENADKNGEVSEFMKLITMDDYSDTMSEAFETLLAEENMELMASNLKQTIDYLDESEQEEGYVMFPSGNAQLLVTKTKKLGLFNHFEVTPLPVEIYAWANFEGTEIEFDGKEEVLNGSDAWSQEVLPGVYTYKIFYDSPMGKVEEERSFTATLNGNNELNASIETYEFRLYSSDYPEMNYYIDDKEVDLSSMIFDDTLMIPIGLDFDLQAAFEEDGVEYLSNVVHMHEVVDETLVFREYDELQTSKAEEEAENQYRAEIIETNVRLLLQRYLTIYTNAEPERLSDVILDTVPFYESQMENLQNLIEKGTEVQIENFQIVNIEEPSEQQFVVTVEENYLVKKSGEDFKPLQQTSIYTIEVIDDSYYIVDFKM